MTVFNICKLFATTIFASLIGAVVFFVFVYKKAPPFTALQ